MAYTTSCQPEKQYTQSENQEKKFKNLLTKEKNSYICIVPPWSEGSWKYAPLKGAPFMCCHQRWDTYIKRRFLDALVLTSWESRKFNVRQKQGNGNAPWCVDIQPSSIYNIGGCFICIAWGFLCCSVRRTGQCESLQDVEPGTGLAPRLLYVCTNKPKSINKACRWSWGQTGDRHANESYTISVLPLAWYTYQVVNG